MHRKFIIFSLVLLSLFFAREVFAYDENTTHPALTDEIINYYNFLHPSEQITFDEREWIVDGSSLEDIAPRWANHFYDPVRKIGWTGAGVDGIPAETTRALAIIGLPTDRILPATEWVNNSSVQDKYLNYGGNWVWGKGLEYFAAGDEKNAFVALGHALHLLEDMAVPEHTRDDTHIDGSPYEIYASRVNRGNVGKWNIARSLENDELAPPKQATIAGYLASLAEYSNKYFFSKDTINDPKYGFPRIVTTDGKFGYGIDENGEEFPLAKIKVNKVESDSSFVTSFYLENVDVNYPILENYFWRLSRKTVLYGAGVIELFKKQIADEVINKDFPTHLVKYDFSFITPPTFSLVGELARLYNAGRNAAASVVQIFSKLEKSDVSSAEIASLNKEQFSYSPQQIVEANTPNSFSNERFSSPVEEISSKTEAVQGRPQTALQQNFSGGGVSVAQAPAQTENNQQAGSADTTTTTIPSTETATSTATATSTTSTSTNTDQTSTSTTATSTPTAFAGVVVISEIQTAGVDAGDEFIELYNTTSTEIDLSGWSIQYVGGGATTTEHAAKKNFISGNKIGPYGFFLVARNLSSSTDDGYRGSVTADLAHRSFSLSSNGAEVFLVGNQEPISAFNDTDIIDVVNYPELLANQSVERKSFVGCVCSSPQNGGEFLGNGCDIGTADDFELRGTPRPQNSSNLPEPRLTPTQPVIIATSSVSSTVGFEWLPSVDGVDATSTLSYKIFEMSSSSSFLILETTSTFFSETVSEFDREYNFSLQAVDYNGLASAMTSITFFVATSTQPVTTSTEATSTISQLIDTDVTTETDGAGYHYQQMLGTGISGQLISLEIKHENMGLSCSLGSVQVREYNTPPISPNSDTSQIFNVYGAVGCSSISVENFTADRWSQLPTFDPNKYYGIYWVQDLGARRGWYGSSSSDAYASGEFWYYTSSGWTWTTSTSVQDVYFKLTLENN